ncbi:MAG: DUF817 domain-containing protein [Planctomycetia bacterium]|nr:DUF817 domain-containing protein [Planctomycetia bacterium]
MRAGVWEFFVFGLKEARACIFAGSFFVLLLLSKHLPLFGLARYDFLCLAALALQVVLLLTGIESRDEALTLGAFHIIGLALEIFKTQPAIGSWSYPEAGYLKVAGVPLYSGFMYAAVASYMCQAWRLLRFDLVGYPSYWLSVPLSVAIYLNFFTHHFFIDLRWLLLAGVLLVFRRSWLRFTVIEQERSLPLVLTFFLVGFFIWVAENISTYFGAWVYPEQRAGWQIVSFGKISSWTLLVIISGMIVADLKQFREKKSTRSPSVHG